MKKWPVTPSTLFALALVSSWSSPAEGTLARLGGEFQVNSSDGSHRVPAVAALPAGGFVVVWRSEITGDTRVMGRRFGANGKPLGPDFQVNVEAVHGSTYPRVAATNDGTILVVWDSAAPLSVVGRFFDAGGTPLGEEHFLTEPEIPFGFEPAVAVADNDDFVVAWTDSTGGGYEILARQFAPNGDPRGPSFVVGADALEAGQYHPAVASGLPGSFIVTWYAEPQVAVQGRHFQGTEPMSPTFHVATGRSISNIRPEICHREGSFVLTWATDSPNTLSDRAALYRLYDDIAGSTTPPLRVTPERLNVKQNVPKAACAENGGFVIVWGEEPGVRGRTFGGFDQADFSIGNEAPPSLFEGPSVAVLATGDLLVTWSDCTNDVMCNVFAQRFSFSESRECPGDCDVNGMVSVSELVQAVAIALNSEMAMMKQCLSADTDLSYTLSVDELIAAVRRSLEGCE